MTALDSFLATLTLFIKLYLLWLFLPFLLILILVLIAILFGCGNAIARLFRRLFGRQRFVPRRYQY